MTLKTCMLIGNGCYKKGQKMTGGKPTGIVVHSTGANNPNLCRYVQPLSSQDCYTEVINDLGRNKLNNHWNSTKRSACVHAFIGKNINGEIETYQTLPENYCCWGVGNGKKGSYNYNPTARLQFEICEDNLTNADYFNKVFKEAAQLCASWCKKYNLTVDKISSHHESYVQGYGNNHADCDHWLKKFGKDMNWFRSEVQALLNTKTTTTTTESKDTTKTTTQTTTTTTTTTAYKPTVKEWQLAAIADGYKFPRAGADGIWGTECAGVASKAVCKKLAVGYKNRNLTRIVQKVIGFTGAAVDGYFGTATHNAVVAWQRNNGLSADGCVGPATWRKMLGV